MKSPAYRFNTGFLIQKWQYWGMAGLLVMLAAFVLLLFRGVEARRADVAGARNRKATKMALARLKAAEGFLKKNLYSAFYEALHKALLGFISDKLNMGAEDMNRETIAAALAGRNVPSELVGRFTALLDACEFARYSPDGGNEAMASHYEEAADVISSMDYVMKSHKKTALSGTALAAAALMAVSPAAEAGNSDAYLDSLWNAGTEAYVDGQWDESIRTWQSIEDTGVESPELYYNLGNACFKSGDNARAILYYERALKSDPSFGDARFNLEFANAGIRDKIDAVPEFVLAAWARKTSRLMDSDAWAWTSLLFLAVTLALLLLFRLGGSGGMRRVGFYGSIVAVLLMLMAFSMSVWQKNSFQKADYAIVMTPVSAVKSSPGSEAAKDLFVLHEGTKVKLLDSVGDWLNISLPDGRQGWIRGNEIEII